MNNDKKLQSARREALVMDLLFIACFFAAMLLFFAFLIHSFAVTFSSENLSVLQCLSFGLPLSAALSYVVFTRG